MPQLAHFERVVQDTSGNAVSGASAQLYREGATVNGAHNSVAPITVTVRHRGRIAAGDTVFIGTGSGTTYAVDSVTATTVVLSGFGGTLVLAGGERIVPSNSLPTLYLDDQGGATKANPLTSSATGRVEAFIEIGVYEVLTSGAGVTTTLYEAVSVMSEGPTVLYSSETDSATAVAHVEDTRFSMATAGSKLKSGRNAGVEKWFFDKDGKLVTGIDADLFATGSSTGGIQEAISSLGVAGGLIRLSAKTYNCSVCVWLPSNVHLRGSGVFATIIKRTAMANGDANNSGAVIATGATIGNLFTSGAPGSNIAVSDLTVDGNYASFGAVTNANLIPSGLRTQYVDGVVIENVRSQNVLADGFRFSFCRNLLANNLMVDTVGQWGTVAARNGLNLIGDAAGAGEWGYNHVITNVAMKTVGDEAIQCGGMNLVLIDNVSCDGCDFVFESSNTAATGGTLKNWTINNITARNVLSYMITFNATSPVMDYENIAFSNCVMEGHPTLHDGGAIALPATSGFNFKNLSFDNCQFLNINTLDTTTHHWLDSQPSDTIGHDGILLNDCIFVGKSGSTRTGDQGINIRGPHRNVKLSNVLLKNVSGTGVRLNDQAAGAITMQDVTLENVTVDGATGFGFRVTSATATGLGTLKNISFVDCTARDTNSVSSGAGFDVLISEAGATIQKLYFRGCRAYKTSGTTMTYGLFLTRSAGILDDITIENCDFSGTQTNWIGSSGTVTNVHFTPPPGRGTDILSAATIMIPQDGDGFHVTAANNITNGITVNPWDNGRTVKLIFDSTPTVSDTGTSRLAGNLVATADDALTIWCDGTNWFELARSVN